MTITINQRTVTVTAPTVVSGTKTYSGSAQNLLSAAGSCSAGGTMYWYSSNPTTSSTAPAWNNGSGWTTTSPGTSTYTGTNAGTYYVWYYCKVADTANNTGSNINTVKSVSKAIGKYTPTLTLASTSGTVNANATGNFKATPTTIAGCQGTLKATSASSTYVTVANASGGTFGTNASFSDVASGTQKTFYYKGVAYTTGTNVTVGYEPTNTGNCNNASTKTFSAKVNRNTGSLSLNPTSGTLTYGTNGTSTITKTGNGNISCESSDTSIATCSVSGTTLTITPIVNPANGETATITVTMAQTGQYTSASATYIATFIRQSELYVSSSGNDSTGYGTIDKPYATLAKAYQMASDTATIYLMSDLTENSSTSFDSEKDITLKSCTKSGSGASATCSYSTSYSIIRGSSLTSRAIIEHSNGTVTLQNIIVDGNNISASTSLIILENDAHIVIGTGAVIKNGISTSDYGGGVRGDQAAIIELDGGEVSSNAAPSGGGIHMGYGKVIIKSGTITNNRTTNESIFGSGGHGGGVFVYFGTLNISGGEVTNNAAPNGWGGGVYIDGTKVNITGGTVNGNTAYDGEYVDIYTSWGAISKITDTNASFNVDASRSNTSAAYKIASAGNNNYVLDVDGAAYGNNVNVQLYTYNATQAQKWNFGLSRIINGVVYYGIQGNTDDDILNHAEQYLWVQSNASTPGSNVMVYEPHQNSGGYWHLEPADNDYYYIKNGNLCLDVSDGTMANGQNIQIYTCNQTNAQKWKIIPVDTPQTSISITSQISTNQQNGFTPSCDANASSFPKLSTFTISVTGGDVYTGYTCAAETDGGSVSYCRSYSYPGPTAVGYACFNSTTSWQYYHSSNCTYATAMGTHGLSTSKYQC